MTRRAVRGLLLVLLPLAVVGFVTYRLLEPVFVYTTGWRDLPPGPYPAVSAASPDWPELAAEADAWLEQARARLGAPALSAAVSIDGRRVWAGAAGYAELDGLTAVTPDTAFRIGSTSKPVTAVAMATLIEEGVVDPDAPAAAYVPDLSGPLAGITTRQAMSHTAGVREYGICLCFPIWEYYGRTHYETQRDALGPFEKSKLLFRPGESFSYSSYGFNLAGAVIEGSTGAAFGEVLARRVLEPLGMGATHLPVGRSRTHDAVAYEVDAQSYKRTFPVDLTNRLPSGGIMSTPTDMVRLGHQMIVPTLFSPATRDLLVMPQPLANGAPNPQGYGLGWRRHDRPLPHREGTTRMLHHNGQAYGGVSNFAVYPDYGVVVSVMMNRNAGGPSLYDETDVLTALAFRAVETRRAR